MQKRSSERCASTCDSLQPNGACHPGLDHALPAVAEWKLSSLPRYLDADQVARLVDSCSKDGPQGLRDRAIVLLLLRLGLRAGDIVSMRPRDIDWQDATLLVRGKGPQRRPFTSATGCR
jgi:site-specific recombinase XerC